MLETTASPGRIPPTSPLWSPASPESPSTSRTNTLRISGSKDTSSAVAGTHGELEDEELRAYLKGLIGGTPFNVTDGKLEDKSTGKRKVKMGSEETGWGSLREPGRRV